MTYKIKNAKTLHKKSDTHLVKPIDGSSFGFDVISGSSGNVYKVAVQHDHGATCNCRWGYYRKWSDPKSACSHVQAVFEYLEQEKARRTSSWTNEEDAERQHRPTIELGDGVIMTSRVTS